MLTICTPIHYQDAKKQTISFYLNLPSVPAITCLQSAFYIANFLKEEQVYLQDMVMINMGDTISFDHTFKVATNIGYLREDNVWVPQYDSLFLVMNGVGKIVTWQFTKGTYFTLVEQVLRDLNIRSEQQQCKITTVYIDNCCSLRNKIQSALGNDISVKLDIFHAVQRIVRTLPKRHECFYKCLERLRLVFRADGDSNKKRTSNTPSPDIMLRRCKIRIWKESIHIGNISGY